MGRGTSRSGESAGYHAQYRVIGYLHLANGLSAREESVFTPILELRPVHVMMSTAVCDGLSLLIVLLASAVSLGV